MRGFRGAIGVLVFGVLLATLACAPTGGYTVQVELADGTVEVDTCRVPWEGRTSFTCGRTWHREHVVSYRLTANQAKP